MTAKETAGAPSPPHRHPGPATRRRGSKLEAAILQAAWDELTEDGYAAFTMERVAVRAKTSRAVLYRRWPNRPELVVAALAHHAQLAPMDVPDTGTLRDDLLALLRRMSEGVGEAAGVLSFFIAEYSRETGQSPSTLRERAIAGAAKTQMTLILEHAIARGEIDPGRLSPRIASLPVDLVRHDLIMTQAPVPDSTLVEIIDKIFLPLVRASEPRSSLTWSPQGHRLDRPGGSGSGHGLSRSRARQIEHRRDRWRALRSALALQQVADRGHDFGHDAEMAKVIEDDQFRARDNCGGVMRVDDVDHAVASAVQDSYRALDGCDIKGDLTRAVSQAIVGVALQAPARTRRQSRFPPRRTARCPGDRRQRVPPAPTRRSCGPAAVPTGHSQAGLCR